MDSSLVDKALNVHSRNAFRIIVRLVNETAMAQAFKVKTTGPHTEVVSETKQRRALPRRACRADFPKIHNALEKPREGTHSARSD